MIKPKARITSPSTLDLDAVIQRVEIISSGPISNWKIFIDDTANATGLPQVDSGSAITISAEDDNGIEHILMKGYIDDPKPSISDPTAVWSRNAVIEGRSSARDLSRLFYRAKFNNTRIGDIFNVPLTELGSELHAHPQLVAQGNAQVDLLEPNDTYLIDLFNTACEKLGYGYLVDWRDNTIMAYPLANTPSYDIRLQAISGVTVGNNILAIREKPKIGSTVHNYVKIKAGSLSDHWTEETAQYLTPGDHTVTLHDDYTVFIAGKSSIRVNCTNSTYAYSSGILTLAPSVKFVFPVFNCPLLDYSNIPQENCSISLTHDKNSLLSTDRYTFIVVITDDQNHKLYWIDDGFPFAEWKNLDFILGYNAPKGTGIITAPKRVWVSNFGTGSYDDFNWKIKELAISFIPENEFLGWITGGMSGFFTGNFWIDGLVIPNADTTVLYAIAEDANSIAKHGKSMVCIDRKDIKKWSDLQRVANEELAIRSNTYEKLSLICTFQYNMLFPGLLADVLIPSYGIGSEPSNTEKWMVTSIKHVISDDIIIRGETAVTELELIRAGSNNSGLKVSQSRINQYNNPMFAAYESTRRRVETLEDRQVIGGVINVTNTIGGSGGSGEVDWLNVPYARVHQNVHIGPDLPDIADTQQFLNIESNPFVVTDWDKMRAVLRFYDPNNPHHGGHNFDFPNSASIRFFSNKQSPLDLAASLYQVLLNVEGPNTGIVCSHHFFIRKDLLLNGMINSLEGAVVLHGSPENRKWTSADDSYPTIFSSQENTNQGGVDYNEIRFRNFYNQALIPINVGGIRDILGSLGAAGQVLSKNSSNQMVWADGGGGNAGPYHPHDQSLNTVDAARFRNLTIETVNGAAVDGTGATGNLTTWGSINCHGTVATSHLRSATATTSNNVMLWSNILPVNDYGTTGASGRFLGNSQYFWSAIYGGLLCIDEITVLPASTFGGIRINSPIRDPNGSRGTAGQVYTSRGPNDAPTWQNPQGSSSTGPRIEHGQVQTNAAGDDVIVNFSPAFQTQPHITTGMLDSTGRPLNVTITSLIGQNQNDLRAGFRIRATTLILENGSHNHDNGTRFIYAQKPSDNPDPYDNPSNVPNHKHFYSDWYFEQVNGYDMQQGVYRRGNTGNTDIATNFARPRETTIHWIAIGT